VTIPTVAVAVEPAPSSPLNLRLGVAYAPRIPTPPFLAYAAIETAPDVFEIYGYDNGRGAVLFTGGIAATFERFAAHLRMDVTP
jgi:hypothetical protein